MNADSLTRWPVRLALLLYAASLVLRITRPAERRTARLVWTAGCVLFLLHVAAAFHFFHGWSHQHAYRETARETGARFGAYWGGGLYLNYLFTLAWAADAAWWWRAGLDRYRSRPRWIDVVLHAFMLFMAFNATVVFERGPVRWAGVAISAALGAAALARLRGRR